MMRANAGSLADLQRAFQDYVLASQPGFTAQVRDTSKADRVILLDAGRIIEDETPKALIATFGRTTLEEVFLDVVRGRAKRTREEAEQSSARKAS